MYIKTRTQDGSETCLAPAAVSALWPLGMPGHRHQATAVVVGGAYELGVEMNATELLEQLRAAGITDFVGLARGLKPSEALFVRRSAVLFLRQRAQSSPALAPIVDIWLGGAGVAAAGWLRDVLEALEAASGY